MMRLIGWMTCALLIAAGLGGLIGYFAYCFVYP
ncbi:hypothetical protein Kompost2_00007 [Pseudomonas phage vB_PpuP-Kompost-2]